jgi:Domain of unknown function (DUF4158)
MALNRWESVSVREPKKCLTMEHWRLAYLGRRRMPRNLSEFELATFFTFSSKERALINARRGPLYRLALPLHIDFVRMTGATLDAYQYVPPILWRHLASTSGSSRQTLERYALSTKRVFSLRPDSSRRNRTHTYDRQGTNEVLSPNPSVCR